MDNHFLLLQTGDSSCMVQQYIDYVLWLVVEEGADITTCVPTPFVPGSIHPVDVLILPEHRQISSMPPMDIKHEATADTVPEPTATTMPEPMPEPNIAPEPKPNGEYDQLHEAATMAVKEGIFVGFDSMELSSAHTPAPEGELCLFFGDVGGYGRGYS